MARILIIMLALFTSASYAEREAVTDSGAVVILNDDNTWSYKHSYKKPAASKLQLKSKENDSAFWVNTNKWDYSTSTDNEDAEFEFELKGEYLYGITITEDTQIGVRKLTDIAVDNAKEVAPDIVVVKREYRTVNGLEVLHMEMKGHIDDLAVTYLGYYYSDDSGSTQHLVYCETGDVDKYRSEAEAFLNGLAVQ